jgi:hypothetical protein
MKQILLLMSLLSATACTTGSTVVSGQVTDPVEMTQVQVLYRTPQCGFEKVADIQFSGGYFSRAALIDAFREKAASVGANVVQVTMIQQVGSNEYFGSARALRCM